MAGRIERYIVSHEIAEHYRVGKCRLVEIVSGCRGDEQAELERPSESRRVHVHLKQCRPPGNVKEHQQSKRQQRSTTHDFSVRASSSQSCPYANFMPPNYASPGLRCTVGLAAVRGNQRFRKIS